MQLPAIKIGKFTGNGAVKNIVIGFKPDYVRVVNITDADITHEWFRDGSAAGTSIDTAAAVAGNAADGITEYPLATTANPSGAGFTVGTDISENGKVYGYVAMRGL